MNRTEEQNYVSFVIDILCFFLDSESFFTVERATAELLRLFRTTCCCINFRHMT